MSTPYANEPVKHIFNRIWLIQARFEGISSKFAIASIFMLNFVMCQNLASFDGFVRGSLKGRLDRGVW